MFTDSRFPGDRRQRHGVQLRDGQRACLHVRRDTDCRWTRDGAGERRAAMDAFNNPNAQVDVHHHVGSDATGAASDYRLGSEQRLGNVGDGLTNDTMPTLTGTAEANSTVTIFADSGSGPVQIGTVVAAPRRMDVYTWYCFDRRHLYAHGDGNRCGRQCQCRVVRLQFGHRLHGAHSDDHDDRSESHRLGHDSVYRDLQ